MKLSKCFKHAFSMVLNSRLRSWLTIIGIVIGVASVIAITSIGEGMQQSIESQMGGLGADLLTITPGFSKGGSSMHQRRGGGDGSSAQATDEEIVLDRTDVQALRGISDIEFIETEIGGSVDVDYMGKTGTVSLKGVDPKVWSDVTTTEIEKGRLLDSADQNVIVIGGDLAASYFDQPVGINKMLTIENNAFRVVGILDDTSKTIYIPIQMAYQLLDDKETDEYDSIIVKVKNEEDLENVILKVEKKLMTTRHVTEKERDFSIFSGKQLMETISEIMSGVSLFLTAIAAISLIVGAVGIANTMFTSVLEKTKEIGIMKAIGAKNRDILLIFLFNATLIGLVGGLIGVILGVGVSGLLPMIMSGMMGSRGDAGTFVTLNSVLIALGVSMAVGITAGFIPAYNGSKLKPVDALRYE
jgi:putative ABC transport system permease protein